jgi:two-component sensor histidine kinase
MLQELNEQQANALAHAADAEGRAKKVANPKPKTDHQRMAHSWRLLARSYEFQHALERFISFQKSKRLAGLTAGTDALLPSATMQPRLAQKEAHFLYRLARRTQSIRPFSATAVSIAVGAVAAATLLRWLSGSTVVDLRFGVYVAAIMATGTLAGMPAAMAAAAGSILIVLFAFVPPYFVFKWPDTANQISLALAAFASLATIYFAHRCRVVLRLLYRRELANQILVNELEHRRKNVFLVNQLVVRKSLADLPERAGKILGRLRAVSSANDLLTETTASPITIRGLLTIQFAPYGEERLTTRGPEVEIAPDAVRHLVLIFHELVTNAAKYGALASAKGQVSVEWRWNGGRRIVLKWIEIGGPEVLSSPKKGFGGQLIVGCANALDGTAEMSFGCGGYSCAITARIR